MAESKPGWGSRCCDPARRARRIRGQPGTEVVARDPRRVASIALVLGAAELDPLWRLVSRSAEHPDVLDPGPALARQALLEISLSLDRSVEALDYETVRPSLTAPRCVMPGPA